MRKKSISLILIFKGYLSGLFFEKKPKNTNGILIWNIDQVKFDFLDDFWIFFSLFFSSHFLKNEPDEGYLQPVILVEKKSGYSILEFILNFNDRFFQKKNIKLNTDLKH